MAAEKKRPSEVRCAIYTRKSTEEGLDQAFNSLDAQREACAAYIASQRHEGWSLLPGCYDDGGYSGGNMDRPGLAQLLGDVRAGRVDVIVVYKVDRLTRSLSDFAKIVDVLDAASASFVSITQSFNTTTSMGRLTLNVLLSFAQFEREVISERVRDKVAASKKKGMWMGGPIPLGYDVQDRKLVINEAEAELVRQVYQRYLDVGSARALLPILAADGVRTKRQHWSNGTVRGGQPFSRGQLYHLLQNRLYLGEVVYDGQSYPGQHEPIIDQQLWEAVQKQMGDNRVERRLGTNHRHLSLLAGMVSDADQGPLTVEHASKGTARYRYYVSQLSDAQRRVRVPATKLEQLVITGLGQLLSDPAKLLEQLAAQLSSDDLDRILAGWTSRAAQLATMKATELRAMLRTLDLRISIEGDSLAASIAGHRLVDADAGTEERIPLPMPARIIRRGQEQRLVYMPKQGAPARCDETMIQLMAKAHATRRGILDGTLVCSADQTGVQGRRDLMRLARLSYLAPDIVQAILDGTQPAELTARRMLREADIPLSWVEQRKLFGFVSA